MNDDLNKTETDVNAGGKAHAEANTENKKKAETKTPLESLEKQLEKTIKRQKRIEDDKKFKVWIHAMRLRTLPLSLSGLALGASAASLANTFSLAILIMSLVTGLCLQILSNFANDYGDGNKGTDGKDRLGPMRTVAAGLISQKEMLNAIKLSILLTIISTIILLFISFGTNLLPWLIFGVLTVLSIIAALAYTMGKNPYGYSGKGDLFVFVFFGLVAVIGSYYLYGGDFYHAPFFPAIAAGLFSTAVLNVNNIRDMKSDALHGKRTFALSLGEKSARQYHVVLISSGILLWISYLLLMHTFSSLILLVFAAPVLYSTYQVYYSYDAKVLDAQLRITAMGTGFFHIMLAVILPVW